jgi:hypothetical protein
MSSSGTLFISSFMKIVQLIWEKAHGLSDMVWNEENNYNLDEFCDALVMRIFLENSWYYYILGVC